ncbi:MAG: exonuclease SbcCD subunit D C-terminal domain-containing protein [Proteobacteria bacterium]|nr:exonuclease SbcCD subunit D C-terminal domain-containing protein [Pseudomonadota bacterium]
MRVLHTSDWHLGRALYGRRRDTEFEKFLSWMLDVVVRERVDVLLVSGDVFDTSAPGLRAQALYYDFLRHLVGTPCRHVVITAGNHDSAAWLSAPGGLLKSLGIHVVGSVGDVPGDDVLVLECDDGALIVCAVPYLRERDVRVSEAGESVEDKGRKYAEGVRQRYEAVAAATAARRGELSEDVPVIAMGHLFASGGKTVDGDGVRELYVGTLSQVSASVFGANFDYVALGHLHVPQKVGGSEMIRYSGSPLAMGFGEAGQQKSVCLVDFEGRKAHVRLIGVPVFQRMARVSGDWVQIFGCLEGLLAAGESVWVEVVYEGQEVVGDLKERVEGVVQGSCVEVLRIRNNRVADSVMARLHESETLDSLDAYEVFDRLLAKRGYDSDQSELLRGTYRELVNALRERDGE